MRRLLLLTLFFLLLASPANAVIAVIANTAAATVNTLNVTTTGIDTTGANLLVVVVADLNFTAGTLSDSKGNTWTPGTGYGSNGNRLRLYYSTNSPNVGTSHTFTYGHVSDLLYPSIAVIALSGAHATAPYDQINGTNNAGSVTAISTGSVTPSANNEILIAGLVDETGETVSINSTFVIANQVAFVGGTNYGVALAYKIQTTLGAENPQWSWTTSANAAANIVTFKVAAAVTTSVKRKPLRTD